MNWFDEQIKQRKKSDNEAFEDSFVNIASAIMGSKMSSLLNDERIITKNAIDEILKFYNIKTRDIPENIKDMNEQLEYILRPHGIMRRNVKLSNNWYKDAMGAMLGIKKDTGVIVSLIPTGMTGYSYIDPTTKQKIKINESNVKIFDEEAIVFYKPFPLRAINVSDLLNYMLKTLACSDLIMIAAATLAISFVGIFIPTINNLLFSDVLNSGNISALLAISIFFIGVICSGVILDIIKNIIASRISTKMNVPVQAAMMMRVMSLPAKFFKEFSAGELSGRAQYINTLCTTFVNSILTSGLTSIFSLVYISQILIYAKALVTPAIAIIITTLIFTTISTIWQMNITKKQMENSSKTAGMTYALISGVQKIKLSGSEKRAFARWANLFAKGAELTYNPPVFLKINIVISTAISLIGMIVIYVCAVIAGISVADYYAFNVAYGMVSGAFMSLAGTTLSFAKIKPTLDMIKPIMDAVPEISEGKQIVTSLSGGIEINNVSFRYAENMPLVIDNLSLKIKAGQYVAIVGKTGCGKSTILRTLLGFETPQKGAIYYDGKDISSLDLKSLRQKIGVVMQDGKLFMGDIFSNITISSPWLTLDEAWEAAELAGIAEDIRNMPMGMHTIISEGSGGISGGQRQRIMIARAIAPKPKILMFDEATSALDNITQRTVSDSLNSLKCTRIIIAHRLSTIKQCDRIIVLDNGKIIEDGSYEELIKNEGYFSGLVERQRLDDIEKLSCNG